MSRLKAKPPEQSIRRKPKVLIFGKSGIGKTWGALDFPACYYVDTEGGAKEPHYIRKLQRAGSVYMGPEDGALDFKEVANQVQALATEKHVHQTLIIDSFSEIFKTAVAVEQERLGDKDTFGQSKKPAVNQSRRLVNWLHRVDMNVILVAHAKEQWGLVTNAQGKTERAVMGYTYDAWDGVDYCLDLVLHVEKTGPRRTMTVRKTRFEGFVDSAIHDWSYDKFAELYGRDILERETTQNKLITDEQLAELMRFRNIGLISDEDEFKIFKKCHVDTLAELFSVDADKCIDAAKKKLTQN